jgi:hypothetical protein
MENVFKLVEEDSREMSVESVLENPVERDSSSKTTSALESAAQRVTL